MRWEADLWTSLAIRRPHWWKHNYPGALWPKRKSWFPIASKQIICYLGNKRKMIICAFVQQLSVMQSVMTLKKGFYIEFISQQNEVKGDHRFLPYVCSRVKRWDTSQHQNSFSSIIYIPHRDSWQMLASLFDVSAAEPFAARAHSLKTQSWPGHRQDAPDVTPSTSGKKYKAGLSCQAVMVMLRSPKLRRH